MLDFDKIREVCEEYQQLGYAKGEHVFCVVNVRFTPIQGQWSFH
jgi:hypothetical protein